MRATTKLTKANIYTLKPESDDEIIFDPSMPGFGFRIRNRKILSKHVVSHSNANTCNNSAACLNGGRLTFAAIANQVSRAI